MAIGGLFKLALIFHVSRITLVLISIAYYADYYIRGYNVDQKLEEGEVT